MNELDLFVAALAISDPQSRSAYLERECRGDADLTMARNGRRNSDDALAIALAAGKRVDIAAQSAGVTATGAALAHDRPASTVTPKYPISRQFLRWWPRGLGDSLPGI